MPLVPIDRDAAVARIAALVAQPSVGADPAFAEGMEGARRLLEARLAELGFTGARRLDGGGHPALYAERLDAPGRPTLLVYGHYDVQPPDPLGLWRTPPFEATVRDGRLYGRGASDDKGPTVVALEAMAALIAADGRLPCNVKVLLEGEEETGSPSLPAILRDNAGLLACDAVLSADGGRWRADMPTINVAARGSGGLEFRVTTAAKDLHSGRFGGAVGNALHAAARIVASLHDAEGRIAVPGLLDGVDTTEAERAEAAAIPFDEAAFLSGVGAVAPFGDPDFTAAERLWLRPTVECNGMWGGYQGPGGKTVIPCEAHAKLTVRMVAGQRPAAVRDALIAHLHAACPPWARLEIPYERGWSPAYALNADNPLLRAAEDALETVYRARPLRVRMGASLPLTGLIAEALGVETVMFSFAVSDEDYHAPNEFFRLSSIDEGVAAWADLLRRVGRQTPADYRAGAAR
jgi:acetylornithine deacetylase/succinyl-diaminopimelate desuccinylase-like protein